MKLALPSTLLLLALGAIACGPPPKPEPYAVKVAEASSNGLAVEVRSTAAPAVGLNKLFYRVTSNGQPVKTATVVQKPLMKMMSNSHSCPQVAPAGTANAEGYFEGTVIFTMASSDAEPWELTLEVTPEGAGSATTLTFPAIVVADRDVRRTLTLGTGASAERIIFTLNFASGPAKGSNDYVLSAHNPGMGAMPFPAQTGLSIKGTPHMPSMGHGSSGNVDPTHQGDGLYSGKASFSMEGDWVLKFEVTRAGTSLGTFEYALAI